MATQVEVVYPSSTAIDLTTQNDIGPFFVPDVVTLLRAELRGRCNFVGTTYAAGNNEKNVILWAVQWTTGGAGPANIVTTADGPAFLMREQLGAQDVRDFWAVPTDDANIMQGDSLHRDWAGQIAINTSIDLYLSFAVPTGVTPAIFNMYGSLRFWWA